MVNVKIRMLALLLCSVVLLAASDVAYSRFSEVAGVGGEADYRSYSASAADYDGDGLLDLYVVNFLRGNYLYRNNGNGTFSEVGENAGVADPGKGTRSAWADYDLDGDPDLFVANDMGDGDRLFRNEGDGTFKDMTLNSGLRSPVHTGSLDADWTDYDLDGYPDLFVVRNGHLVHADGLSNVLYRNNGDGTFTDVTDRAGLLNYGAGMSSSWADYDLDGYPDLYVANFTNIASTYPDSLSGALYKNNGDGTFTDVTGPSGTANDLGGYEAAWADYDLDGDPDLYLANVKDILPSSENRLYRNEGDGTFTDVATAAGAGNTGSTAGAVWADFDLDGDKDLFITNVELPPLYYLYRNNGDGTFTDVADDSGIDAPEPGQWPLAADFSGDGYPDIFIPKVGYGNALYLNEGDGLGAASLKFSGRAVRPRSVRRPRPTTPLSSADDTVFEGVRNVAALDARTAEVGWETSGAGGDRYYIFASAEQGRTDADGPADISDPDRSSWVIGGLEPDTIYYVRVYRESGGAVLPNEGELTVRTLPSSYEAEVRPIFTYGCVFLECHASGASPAQGLVLGEGIEVSALIDVPSSENPSMDRIEPFKSDESYIYHKINGTQAEAGGSGLRMPYERIDPLRDYELEAVKDWIDGGAKQVALSAYCGSNRVSEGEDAQCYLNVHGGEGSEADLYTAMRLPDGGTLYFSGGKWTESPAPYIEGIELTALRSYPFIRLTTDVFDRSGNHDLLVWLVQSGGDPGSTADWLSNRSGFELTIEAVGGQGCFIANSAFGPPGARYVKLLREFRDIYLLSNAAGKWLVRLYYRYAPGVAHRLERSKAAKTAVRLSLMPAVGFAWLCLKAGFWGKALAFSLASASLAGGIYFSAVIFAASRRALGRDR